MLETSQYMYAEDVTPEGRKTRVIAIRSKSSNALLGHIKWYGAWRQYTFFPEPTTVFNVDCMVDICREITRLKQERRKA